MFTNEIKGLLEAVRYAVSVVVHNGNSAMKRKGHIHLASLAVVLGSYLRYASILTSGKRIQASGFSLEGSCPFLLSASSLSSSHSVLAPFTAKGGDMVDPATCSSPDPLPFVIIFGRFSHRLIRSGVQLMIRRMLRALMASGLQAAS